MSQSATPIALAQDDQADPGHARPAGILPDHMIRDLIDLEAIRAPSLIRDKQLQPASLDLRLGPKAYRVQASFLPSPKDRVIDKIERYGLYDMDLTEGAVLERGCVYIVPLLETLALPDDISGATNPKSSTGRLDIFTRMITDHTNEFDRVRPGYAGQLYAEISPRTFSIKVREGTTLSQLRLRRGEPVYSDQTLQLLQEQRRVVGAEPGEENIARGIAISIDLAGDESGGIIGYKAKRDAGVIDYDVPGEYEPLDFWEPIHASDKKAIVLNLDDFYILASKEAISIPEDHAAEMVAYDTLVGEFRVHYAGFFDPGFGRTELGAEGTRAVLEVRPHEVPFMVEDGQVVGRLLFEPLLSLPDRLYGTDIGSSYQRQGLALSKHFKR
ncbi:MAG: 2'-deoxycytidine 5'-triphosphate deaminase [Alphaproteobacteria bacterium]|nr:2'-deoxycytidine 5'-triphosphate deaminase [Alphaproteobacteria bacterium]